MSIDTINRAKLKLQIENAKARGLATVPVDDPPPVLPKERLSDQLPLTPVEAKVRRTGLENDVKKWLTLDYAVLSAVFGVEINGAISPLRIQSLLRNRLEEMKRDGLIGAIPDTAWEMLSGLNIACGWELHQHIPGNVQLRKRDENTLLIKAETPAQCHNLISKRSVQMLLQELSRSGGSWSIEGSDITLKGDLISCFSFQQLQRVWVGCCHADSKPGRKPHI